MTSGSHMCVVTTTERRFVRRILRSSYTVLCGHMHRVKRLHGTAGLASSAGTVALTVLCSQSSLLPSHDHPGNGVSRSFRSQVLLLPGSALNSLMRTPALPQNHQWDLQIYYTHWHLGLCMERQQFFRQSLHSGGSFHKVTGKVYEPGVL